jgi:hypothetical protein
VALPEKLALVAPAGTMTLAGTVIGVAVERAGRISQMARLYRSEVGAVSLMLTVVPLIAIGLFCFWTQYVSPTGAKY